jgi:ferredoxin
MSRKVIILRLGEQDVFVKDPYAVLAENGIGEDLPAVEFNHLAAAALERGNPELVRLFAGSAECICCASRPRAVRALLDFCGIDIRPLTVTWLALEWDAHALKKACGTPWYPVIDRDRCTGCGICHDYCLFSTYRRDDQRAPARRVRVEAPLNCKPGCPACARLCGSGALIFPFCPEASLNGALEGDAPPAQSDLLREFEADPMKVLEERRRKRRLLDDRTLADAERNRFLRE